MDNTQYNPYYRHLNMPGEWFNKVSLVQDITQGRQLALNGHWKKWGLRSELFNSRLHEFLDNLGCEVMAAELFYTMPRNKIFWHTDMGPAQDFIKINFVWGSDDHIMEWGEVKDSINQNISFTKAGTQYVKYNDNEINKTASTKLVMPTLVNVGRPHRVVNFSDTGRWCLCLMPKFKDRNIRMFFNEFLETFNEYVLG
jgi:hypothetical protein